MARIIGLTGKYCAGKNAVAGILEGRGYPAIDVDKLGHRVYEEAAIRAAVASRFGEEVLRADGAVDRKKLGARAFASAAALRDLEAIVHPGMIALLDKELEARTGTDFAINAALLLRFPQAALCAFIIVVEAPLALRLRRAARRDGVGPLGALKRVWRQRSMFAQPSPPGVDIYRVENRGSLEALEEAVGSVLKREGA